MSEVRRPRRKIKNLPTQISADIENVQSGGAEAFMREHVPDYEKEIGVTKETLLATFINACDYSKRNQVVINIKDFKHRCLVIQSTLATYSCGDEMLYVLDGGKFSMFDICEVLMSHKKHTTALFMALTGLGIGTDSLVMRYGTKLNVLLNTLKNANLVEGSFNPKTMRMLYTQQERDGRTDAMESSYRQVLEAVFTAGILENILRSLITYAATPENLEGLLKKKNVANKDDNTTNTITRGHGNLPVVGELSIIGDSRSGFSNLIYDGERWRSGQDGNLSNVDGIHPRPQSGNLREALRNLADGINRRPRLLDMLLSRGEEDGVVERNEDSVDAQRMISMDLASVESRTAFSLLSRSIVNAGVSIDNIRGFASRYGIGRDFTSELYGTFNEDSNREWSTEYNCYVRRTESGSIPIGNNNVLEIELQPQEGSAVAYHGQIYRYPDIIRHRVNVARDGNYNIPFGSFTLIAYTERVS